MSSQFWLTDQQFARLRAVLPTQVRGVARADDQRGLSGIVHGRQSGGRWADVPAEDGPRTTLDNRFVRWAERGVWQRVFEELAAAAGPPTTVMLDATIAKAHRCAAGGKGGHRPKRSADLVAAEGPKSMPQSISAADPSG